MKIFESFTDFVKENLISGGKGDHTKEQDVDEKQLKVGIEVEKEHTTDENVAKEIAIDHLTEDPQYYTKLIKNGLVDEHPALKLAKELGILESTINEYVSGINIVQQYIKPDEIIIATNEAYHSWEYFSKTNRLFLVLNKKTLKLRIILFKSSKSDEPPAYKNINVDEFKDDLGTFTKPKLSAINMLMKQHNIERSRASSPMSSKKWEIVINGESDNEHHNLKDVFQNEDLLLLLKLEMNEIDLSDY